jgi:hypothetical protein
LAIPPPALAAAWFSGIPVASVCSAICRVESSASAVKIAFRVGRRTRDRKFICSELVDECFRAAGVRFVRPDNYISPQDIWRDQSVLLQARIL